MEGVRRETEDVRREALRGKGGVGGSGVREKMGNMKREGCRVSGLSNQVEGCSRSSTSLMASSTRCMKVDGRRVTGP